MLGRKGNGSIERRNEREMMLSDEQKYDMLRCAVFYYDVMSGDR